MPYLGMLNSLSHSEMSPPVFYVAILTCSEAFCLHSYLLYHLPFVLSPLNSSSFLMWRRLAILLLWGSPSKPYSRNLTFQSKPSTLGTNHTTCLGAELYFKVAE